MAKKRKSGGGSNARGVSGNPARRAAQLRARSQSAPGGARDGGGAPAALLDVLAGRTEAVPWWAPSHAAVLGRAGELAADSALELEDATAEIVGAEYWARFRSERFGFHPDRWLAALTELVCDELETAPEAGEGRPGLRLFVRGLAEMTPQVGSETEKALRRMLATVPGGSEVVRAEPSGGPLVVRDGYGSRFALLAPFAFGASDPHWYCWDIDACAQDRVVGAGVFASPDAAIAEWRGVVGPGAEGAEPAPCSADEARQLLRNLVEPGPLGTLMMGSESRAFIVEQFRMRQRARALLTGRAADRSRRPDLGRIIEDFASWLAERGGGQPAREDIGTLAENWSTDDGPRYYACSPHRIEHAVILVADGYLDEYAEAALDLLPEWVEWCIERSGLTGDLADRARAAARNNRWDGNDDDRDLRRAE